MKDIKKEACKLAIVKLFKDKNFSICTIDNLLKLTNTIPDPETYKILQVLHCVDYSEMSPDFRKELFETVLTMFKNNGFEFEDIEKMYKSSIIDLKPEDDGKVDRSLLQRVFG